MNGDALALEVVEFADVDHWRWSLKDAHGAFLADHAIRLDRNDPRYRALWDLPGYIRHYSKLDNRDEDERRLLQEIGAWLGETLLGQTIAGAISDHAMSPVVVRIVVPPEAEQLLVLPIELAHMSGKPIGLLGVSVVFEVAGDRRSQDVPVGERLRILALFSLPPAGSPLNLRRERQAVQTLVRGLVGAGGLAVDLRVLQYGVTRDSLERALTTGDGWDVVHFSGHGVPGALILEKPDGQPDPTSSTDMARLLRQAGPRLKLVVLSACLSAAVSIEQTLKWIGVETRAPSAGSDVAAFTELSSQSAQIVARALVGALDCAVVAMRYPVGDELATTFTEALYDYLLDRRQTLPRAAELALRAALGRLDDGSAPEARPLSAVTPVLFGRRATGLTLSAPSKPPKFRVVETGLAYFDQEPGHFVGRVRAMMRASAVLGVQSNKSGVLFHGMAGSGKTSCAVELAYHHERAGRFQGFVWYRAPEQDMEIALALRNFALAMERQLPEFAMVHVVDNEDTLQNWLPQLSQMLKTTAVMIVLDNVESLLSETGKWRDNRWALIFEALCRPGGLSRVVLTSRIPPAVLPTGVESIPVHALPLDETVLLVRELPNLRALLDGSAPGLNKADGRELLRQTLRLVQGHPKMIEFAERLAAEPAKLAEQIKNACNVADEGGDGLNAFFTSGETRCDAQAFLDALRNWTKGILDTLSEETRTVFYIMCALEESDRRSALIDANWPELRERLNSKLTPPDIPPALDRLVTVGLVEKELSEVNGMERSLKIHPAVAEVGRVAAGPTVQSAVDETLGAYWYEVMAAELREYGKTSRGGAPIVQAGFAGFPYLSRTHEWDNMSTMVEKVYLLDDSPNTTSSLLFLMGRIVEATAGTPRARIDKAHFAHLLREAGRTKEADELLRANLEEAVRERDFLVAENTCGELCILLMASGSLNEALEVVQKRSEYCRLAGTGDWSGVAAEGQRLQILNRLGRYGEVLRDAPQLQEKITALGAPNDREANLVWNVIEVLYDTVSDASQNLGEQIARENSNGAIAVQIDGEQLARANEAWEQAISYNQKALAIKQKRGASSLEFARTRVRNYGPLLRLRRYDETRQLLDECRAVFERENALPDLGRIYSALGSLEVMTGSIEEARRFEESALRFKYAAGVIDDVAIGHFNLANRLIWEGRDFGAAVAHRLAAVLLRVATRSARAEPNKATLRSDLLSTGKPLHDVLPADFDALCAIVDAVPGARFRQTMNSLVKGAPDELMETVIASIQRSHPL